MSKETITVKECSDCPFNHEILDGGEAACWAPESNVDFYTSGGGYEPFPVGCPLVDGKVFIVAKFWNGEQE